MVYAVVYLDGNVIHTEDIFCNAIRDKGLLDDYLKDLARKILGENNADTCKIAVIDFENNIVYAVLFERKVIVDISRRLL